MDNAHITRTGTVTEYKSGHYYVTRVDWLDGHSELEVHRCEPTLLWHSCDPKQWEAAIALAGELAAGEQQDVKLLAKESG